MQSCYYIFAMSQDVPWFHFLTCLPIFAMANPLFANLQLNNPCSRGILLPWFFAMLTFCAYMCVRTTIAKPNESKWGWQIVSFVASFASYKCLDHGKFSYMEHGKYQIIDHTKFTFYGTMAILLSTLKFSSLDLGKISLHTMANSLQRA